MRRHRKSRACHSTTHQSCTSYFAAVNVRAVQGNRSDLRSQLIASLGLNAPSSSAAPHSYFQPPSAGRCVLVSSISVAMWNSSARYGWNSSLTTQLLLCLFSGASRLVQRKTAVRLRILLEYLLALFRRRRNLRHSSSSKRRLRKFHRPRRSSACRTLPSLSSCNPSHCNSRPSNKVVKNGKALLTSLLKPPMLPSNNANNSDA